MNAPRLLLLGVLATACDLSAGDWFLRLEPRLSARYTPLPERTVTPDWQKLANEREIRVVAATIEIDAITLIGESTSGVTAFDPSRPPPGFGLCHNGHCHASDGRLVPYDEVAQAASGSAAPPVVATLTGGTWDLLADAPPLALPCTGLPACRFGRSAIARVQLHITRLQIEGEVRDGPGVVQPLSPATFRVDLGDTIGPLTSLSSALPLPADNDHDPAVTITLSLSPSAALFDGIDWSAHPPAAGHVDLTTAPLSAATRAAVIEALARVPLTVTVNR